MTGIHTLRLERTFDAPPERVYAMFSDAAQMNRWWAPKDFVSLGCELDPRVGGRWRAAMRGPDGAEHVSSGVVCEIDSPRRLAFTHAWDSEPGAETLVTFGFTAQGGKTRMVFEQSGFADVAARDSHGEGWSEAFDNLDAALAGASIAA